MDHEKEIESIHNRMARLESELERLNNRKQSSSFLWGVLLAFVVGLFLVLLTIGVITFVAA